MRFIATWGQWSEDVIVHHEDCRLPGKHWPRLEAEDLYDAVAVEERRVKRMQAVRPFMLGVPRVRACKRCAARGAAVPIADTRELPSSRQRGASGP